MPIENSADRYTRILMQLSSPDLMGALIDKHDIFKTFDTAALMFKLIEKLPFLKLKAFVELMTKDRCDKHNMSALLTELWSHFIFHLAKLPITKQDLILSVIDVNSMDLIGHTVLSAWILSKPTNLQVGNSLIEKGVNLEKRTHAEQSACTALNYAASYGTKAQVEFLVSKGADLNAKDDEGNTPLIRGSLYGNLDIAESLIASGAALNAQNLRGETALISSLLCEHSDIALLLIQKGAKLDLKDKRKNSALKIAKIHQYTSVIDTLKACHKLNERNNTKRVDGVFGCFARFFSVNTEVENINTSGNIIQSKNATDASTGTKKRVQVLTV
jgi:hypothetical protein